MSWVGWGCSGGVLAGDGVGGLLPPPAANRAAVAIATAAGLILLLSQAANEMSGFSIE